MRRSPDDGMTLCCRPVTKDEGNKKISNKNKNSLYSTSRDDRHSNEIKFFPSVQKIRSFLFLYFHISVAIINGWSFRPPPVRHGDSSTEENSHERIVFTTSGITSLWATSQKNVTSHFVVAGTKNGSLICSSSDDDECQNFENWRTIGNSQSKLPIFSLAAANSCQKNDDKRQQHFLFSGGGDRFVSIWNESVRGQYECIDRLGPHTGWVKDVVYDETNQILHSIGCNCIETWDCSGQQIAHQKKRSVENSPNDGCTLSSDLLCLCVLDDGSLISGGVDGRVHLWSADVSLGHPIDSTRAHDGRINCLIKSTRRKNLLFSAGNDGNLNLCQIANNTLQKIKTCTLEGRPRLATMMILAENDDMAHLVVGTATGQLVAMEINVATTTTPTPSSELDKVQLSGLPPIFALSFCETDLAIGMSPTINQTVSILVGHSRGLSIVCCSKN